MYLIGVGLIHVVTEYFRGNFTSLDIFQLKQITIFHNRKYTMLCHYGLC